MKKPKPETAHKRATLERIAQVVGRELVIPGQPEHGLTPYHVAKWLLYQLAVQDAMSDLREELATLEARIAKLNKSRGKLVFDPDYWPTGRKVPKAELVEELQVDRNELMARSMEHFRQDEQEMSFDDRDSYYDEGVWDLAGEIDPEFEKPLMERSDWK